MRPTKALQGSTQTEPAVAGDLSGTLPYRDPTGNEATAKADRANLQAQCRECGAVASARLCGGRIVECLLPRQGRGGRWHRHCGGKLEFLDTAEVA
jgi:hypothetical protein